MNGLSLKYQGGNTKDDVLVKKINEYGINSVMSRKKDGVVGDDFESNILF